MSILIAQSGKSLEDIFGKITPPPGPSVLYGDPFVALGTFFGTLLNITLIVFGIVMLTYMIWGALDWVTSEGDKERLDKARSKNFQMIGNVSKKISWFLFTSFLFRG